MSSDNIIWLEIPKPKHDGRTFRSDYEGNYDPNFDTNIELSAEAEGYDPNFDTDIELSAEAEAEIVKLQLEAARANRPPLKQYLYRLKNQEDWLVMICQDMSLDEARENLSDRFGDDLLNVIKKHQTT